MSDSSNHSSFDAARHAVELMEQLGVLPSPQNYEVWYAYSVGQNQDLVNAVDAIRDKDGFDSNSATTDLHAEFIEDTDIGEAMSEVGAKLTGELATITDFLRQAGDDTKAYGDTLEGVSGQLDSSQGESDTLKQVIDQLVSASRKMSERSKELEGKLKETTSEVNSLRSNLEVIRKEANTDSLTNLGNRKAFDEELARIAKRSVAKDKPACLIMGDIDHFKKFNDTWGHQTGDQVLRLVAHAIKENLATGEIAARYGGEEFCVILYDYDLATAKILADRIRNSVETKKVMKRSTGQDLGTITMSFGVAELRAGEDLGEVIRRADACLYASKRGGRNQVQIETDVDVDAILNEKAA